MALPPYAKPYRNIAQQIDVLQGRGMAIADLPRATGYLEQLGYYRLSGYWYPMRESRPAPAGAPNPPEVLDQFRPGSDFSQVVDLYAFDKGLRLLFLDAIERVEVALRVQVALLLGERSPFSHRDPTELHPRFTTPRDGGPSMHDDWIVRLDKLASKSREQFVKHFSDRYAPPLPIWVAIELWDFGLLSFLISGMQWNDVTKVAAGYGIPDANLLKSWCRSINHVRNICAHHSRIWNRPLVENPKPPRRGQIPTLDHLVGDIHAQSRPYSVAAILQFLLRVVSPGSSWGKRLKEHMNTLPAAPGISMGQTGFPAGWANLPLWR